MSIQPFVELAPDHYREPLPLEHRAVGQLAVRAAELETVNALNAGAMADVYTHLTGLTDDDSDGSYRQRVQDAYEAIPWAESVSDDEVQEQFGGYRAFTRPLAETVSDEVETHILAADKARVEKHDELVKARKYFAGFENNAKKGSALIAEREIDRDPTLPEIFREWKIPSRKNESTDKEDQEPKSWLDWLAEDANNDQLTNFLQYHNDKIRRYNTDLTIRQEVGQRRAEYITGIQKLVDDGYILDDTEQSVKDLEQVSIFAADPFEMYAEKVKGRANARENYLLIHPEFLLDNSNKTFEHELSHFVEKANERWVAETAADFIAAAVMTGSTLPSDICKLLFEQTDKGYNDANLILALMLHDQHGVKLFMNYATAPSHMHQEMGDRLNESLKKITGNSNSLEAITQMMDDVLGLGVTAENVRSIKQQRS